MQVNMTVNGEQVTARSRTTDAAGALSAGSVAAHRYSLGL